MTDSLFWGELSRYPLIAHVKWALSTIRGCCCCDHVHLMWLSVRVLQMKSLSSSEPPLLPKHSIQM